MRFRLATIYPMRLNGEVADLPEGVTSIELPAIDAFFL